MDIKRVRNEWKEVEHELIRKESQYKGEIIF